KTRFVRTFHMSATSIPSPVRRLNSRISTGSLPVPIATLLSLDVSVVQAASRARPAKWGTPEFRGAEFRTSNRRCALRFRHERTGEGGASPVQHGYGRRGQAAGIRRRARPARG